MFTDDERYELQSNEVSCNHLNTVSSATHPDFHQAILNMVVRKNEKGGAWNALLDGEKITGYHQWYCSLLTCALGTNVSGMLRAAFHKLGCWKAGVNHLADTQQTNGDARTPKGHAKWELQQKQRKCIRMPAPPPCHCKNKKKGREKKKKKRKTKNRNSTCTHAHPPTHQPAHLCTSTTKELTKN